MAFGAEEDMDIYR